MNGLSVPATEVRVVSAKPRTVTQVTHCIEGDQGGGRAIFCFSSISGPVPGRVGCGAHSGVVSHCTLDNEWLRSRFLGGLKIVVGKLLGQQYPLSDEAAGFAASKESGP
jgi:hypothetical protein